MGFVQKINALWNKMGIVQKSVLLSVLIGCGVTGFLLTTWATRPEMRLLYKDLDPEVAAQITDKLSTLEVNYELRGGGTAVFVPAKSVHQMRLEMAKDGLPGDKQDGYKIFDDQKIGVSPMVQQMNLTRATQDELAKTIQMIEGVEFSRVHIVRPEETLFTTAPEEATASVVLKLRAGWRLSMTSVAAISNLVSGAVDGLKPEDVTIVDCQGRMLSSKSKDDSIVSTANTFMDYQQRVDEVIAGKVQDMLDTILGPGRSSVKVSSVIDMTAQKTVRKEYEKGIASEEIITKNSTEEKNEAGEESESTAQTSEQSEQTIETKLKLPETLIEKMDTPGRIVSLSVSAVVDLNKNPEVSSIPGTEVGEEEGSEVAAVSGAPEKLMDIEQVKEIIRNAVGPKLLINEEGIEALSVIEAPFHRPATLITGPDGYEKMDKYIEIARQLSMGILSVCALVVLWIFTRAMGKAGTGESAEDKEEKVEIAGLGLLTDGEQDPLTALRQHVSSKFKENPQAVKQLFASWLQEES